MSFSGKVVVVTGASSGIGAAVAEQFAAARAQVVAVGRNQAKLDAVAARCAAAGPAPLVIYADVSNDADARRIIDDTINKFGKIDVLVNNAGILRIAKVLSGKLLETYDEVMNTNLRPIVHLTALAAPHLVETKGNIINISSAAAHKVVTGLLSYGTSKAALNYLTRGLALELAAVGVRVNSVSPGPVATDIAANSGASQEQLAGARGYAVPLGRVAAPAEVAGLVLYLAGDQAVGITGADFVLDNGVQIA